MNYRVILFHKQSTSARTRFLRLANDSVCAFDPIPPLAEISEASPDLMIHPTAVLHEVETRLELPKDSLEAEPEFQCRVEVPGEPIQILLAGITTIDPPFEAAEKAGASFIDITQARGLPPIELQMLRSAYEVILGG